VNSGVSLAIPGERFCHGHRVAGGIGNGGDTAEVLERLFNLGPLSRELGERVFYDLVLRTRARKVLRSS